MFQKLSTLNIVLSHDIPELHKLKINLKQWRKRELLDPLKVDNINKKIYVEKEDDIICKNWNHFCKVIILKLFLLLKLGDLFKNTEKYSVL